MKKAENIFFGFSEGKSSVKIELTEALNQNSDFDWDKNYIRALVSFNNETFQEQFETQFMTVDFEKFKRDLINIYKGVAEDATFEYLENNLKLTFKKNGTGFFSLDFLDIKTSEIHSFELDILFDRTQTLTFINQLKRITELFPIIGNDFRITQTENNYNNISQPKQYQFAPVDESNNYSLVAVRK